MVLGVFSDIEKAYDMVWKEGLLIKLGQMDINGMLFNWIMDFLKEWKIQVRKWKEYSDTIDNRTPQGSVCSPVLFNMINGIFEEIESEIVRSLCWWWSLMDKRKKS